MTEPVTSGAESPETSIVIRTFNEQEHLPRLLESVEEQTYRDWEIIVVDSGSYDRTPAIAVEYGAHFISIDSQDFTFGHSLNVGIQVATGDFVAIVSAHTEPESGRWLESLVEPLRRDGVAMVYGRQLGNARSNYSELRDFGRVYGDSPRLLRAPDFFANNANSAIRRALWEQQPFDEALPGLEDIDWAKHWMERGYQVFYEPAAALYHIHEETWPQVRRRYYREGVAAKQIGIKGRKDIPREVFRESAWLLDDLFAAGRAGSLVPDFVQMALFRLSKTIGTVRGLWDGSTVGDASTKRELYFDKPQRAVVIGRRGEASLRSIQVPSVKPGDVLVRVAYVGVCATDLEVCAGELGYYKDGLAEYPIVPGHEFSGRVAKVGPNVADLAVGDAVVVECIQGCGSCAQCMRGNAVACSHRKEIGVMGRDGAYADYVCVPGRFVHRLPVGTDLKTAALCEPLAVVLKGLGRLERTWDPEGPRFCGIAGAGPIGHLCALVLADRGHQVVVYDLDPGRRELLEDRSSKIVTASSMECLGQHDALIEATGDPDSLETLLARSAPGASILLLGLPYAERDFSFESIVTTDKILVGSVGSGPSDFQAAIPLLQRLDLGAFSQCAFPLERFEQAWEVCRSREYLKAMLIVDQSTE